MSNDCDDVGDLLFVLRLRYDFIMTSQWQCGILSFMIISLEIVSDVALSICLRKGGIDGDPVYGRLYHRIAHSNSSSQDHSQRIICHSITSY